MTVTLRKCMLTAHVTCSVAWLGAVVAYLALALCGITSERAEMVRSAYLSMEVLGWFVIVPLCLASFLTGLVQSLGTEWGLFRHYWVLAKFVLTIISTLILLLHMPTVSRMAALAAKMTLPLVTPGVLGAQLVIHAAGGLLVLIAITVISIFKPWGRIPWGRA